MKKILIFILITLSVLFYRQRALADTLVISSYPLYKICQEIFVDERLYLIGPPKGEFHFVEPILKDWETMKKASFVILVGTEPWAKKVYKVIPREKIFALASPEEKLRDPHLWFDFSRIEKLIKQLLSQPQIRENPNYKNIVERAEIFLNKLSNLQREFKNLNFCKEKEVYTIGHEVFYYLLNEAGIKEIALIKGHHHGEISIKRLKEMLLKAKRRGINQILLTEPEFIKYKEIFLQEGFKVFEAWSGDYDLPGNYIELLAKNLEIFKSVLSCP